VRLAGTADLRNSGPIDVKLEGNTDAAVLALFDDTVKATGDTRLSIAATGTVNQPKFDGFIEILRGVVTPRQHDEIFRVLNEATASDDVIRLRLVKGKLALVHRRLWPALVRLVDRVAYINHDIDDAVRYGLLGEDDLPHEEIGILGDSGSKRIDRLVHDIVDASEGVDDIRQSADVGEAMLSVRAFMFERVYLGAQAAPEHEKAHKVVRAIFDHLVDRGDDVDEIVDYIAGMTDRFALTYAESL
jgi:dGTP triphosphohydrolase